MRGRALLPLILLPLGAIGCSSSSGNTPGPEGGAGDDGGGQGAPRDAAVMTPGADTGMSGNPDAGGTPTDVDSGVGTGGNDSAVGTGGSDASMAMDSSGSSEGGATVTCGTDPSAFDVTKIGRIEQLVSAPDGTIYFSNQGRAIGRYLAPAYAMVEPMWKVMPDASAKVLGIALDPKANILYAGARGSNKLYKIPLDNSAITSVTLPDAFFNGATLGEDGAVYYTNEAVDTTANVYRIGPTDTAPTKINTTPLLHANDLAFGPDGWLYVNQWITPATITRLKLQNGVEVMRELFATLQVTGGPAPGNGDGIAFDVMGNLYASAGALYQVTPTKQITVLAASGMPTAGLEFGCGALSCSDLFYAMPAAAKFMTTAPGMNVPWHRH